MDFLYSLYDALVSIQVPADKARAVIDSMERDMTKQLATKTDLVTLRTELRSEFQFLRHEFQQESALIRKDMQLMESRLTVRLGSIMVVGIGVLFAALKLG
jgi:hypothetical protein